MNMYLEASRQYRRCYASSRHLHLVEIVNDNVQVYQAGNLICRKIESGKSLGQSSIELTFS
jgi:hypothetical protein